MSGPSLSVRNASKTFSGRRVLHSVDLELHPGEVHGLVGQNGSGKSTLIKILAGYHSPDQGCTLELAGRDIRLPLGASDPRRFGIAFVHQDLGLVDAASVLENLFIAGFQTRFPGRIDWRRERARAARALELVGVDLRPAALVGSLAPTERAMLAIARAVNQLARAEGSMLVLDEPTAYLPRDGVNRLFSVIRDAAASGVAVLFVGHDLDEIIEITDRVTVLRDGRRVAACPTADLDTDQLAELILGFRLEDFYPQSHDAVSNVVLRVEDLESERLQAVSLDVRRGEILGLTGLLGSGYEDIPYAVFGAAPASGRMVLEDYRLNIADLRPSIAMRHAIALVPANRLTLGAAAAASATENLTLVTLQHFATRTGRLRHRLERKRAESLMREFDVRPQEPARPFAIFSGGNQQKLVLAKWLELQPLVLVMHEPTQGVDVGARREILARIREIANRGAGVVVASAEYEDLAQLCDRVLIFRRGSLASELSGSELTHERILERCFALDDARRQPVLGES